MSTRPLALGHSELMAQHKNLGVLPPPLLARQPQQRHGTGNNQEDQLQPHKPKIIPRPGCTGAGRTASGQRSIQPGGTGFRHLQLEGARLVATIIAYRQAERDITEAAGFAEPAAGS